MKYNIFDRRRRSVYSTKNSTLPLIIQLQLKPRSRIKLFKIVNPTFSVYRNTLLQTKEKIHKTSGKTGSYH